MARKKKADVAEAAGADTAKTPGDDGAKKKGGMLPAIIVAVAVLAGGAHAGRAGIPLLLSWPDVLPDITSTYLSEVTPVDRVVMYGGVAATSYTVEATSASALG